MNRFENNRVTLKICGDFNSVEIELLLLSRAIELLVLHCVFYFENNFRTIKVVHKFNLFFDKIETVKHRWQKIRVFFF